MFESEYLDTLVTMHREALERYDAERKKGEEIRIEEQRHADLLKRHDAQIETSVKDFENVVYSTNGGTIHGYLSDVLIPYIFLDTPVAPHAKFFRSKLENGDFAFEALTSANVAHYLPELAMNQ